MSEQKKENNTEERFDPGPKELWYDGEGDLLDTAEGRANFCRLNKSSIYRKPDPASYGDFITVFAVQNQSLVIKKRCQADPTLFELKEYDAEGNETNKFYEPYERSL